MAINNGYTTLAELKSTLSISDTSDDILLESAIEAASRQLDAHCGNGRRFWQDTVAVERSYYPGSSHTATVDDISSTDGLVVEIDDADDGSFSQTLVLDTDFILKPINAAAEYPVRPWTSIQMMDSGYRFTRLASHRPHLRVTAKFGWSAVPDAVARACLLQAKTLFKAPDATFGSFQMSIDGQPMRVPPLDTVARGLMEPFVRYDEVD